MQKLFGAAIVAITAVNIASNPLMAQEDDMRPHLACSIANDATYVRDYPTFKPVAKLMRGECMELIPNSNSGAPVKIIFHKGQSFYLVAGISGNTRVVSTQYTQLR